MRRPSVSDLIDRMEAQGHAVFRNQSQPFNLNIVGVRAPMEEQELDEFGDWICVFWKDGREWKSFTRRITTLPGSHYLIRRLLNPRGCAILVPGQYRGAYGLRLHNGKYEALCQTWKSVRVYRDGDRDREFDLDPGTIMRGRFGINIHRAKPKGITAKVNFYSAGCQVFQDADDHSDFVKLCRTARRNWGNRFTYTLLQA